MKYFKPEDFNYTHNNQQHADRANEKLSELIEASPMVYGHKQDARVWKTERSPRASNNDIEMYPEPFSARLMFIEPIVKEPCDHKSNGIISEVWNAHNELVGVISHCIKCKVQLNAEWKEAK